MTVLLKLVISSLALVSIKICIRWCQMSGKKSNLHYILCWRRTLYYVREVLKKSSNFFRKTQVFFGVATHRHRPMSIGRFVWKNVNPKKRNRNSKLAAEIVAVVAAPSDLSKLSYNDCVYLDGSDEHLTVLWRHTPHLFLQYCWYLYHNYNAEITHFRKRNC
jgi:hypothetical protein